MWGLTVRAESRATGVLILFMSVCIYWFIYYVCMCVCLYRHRTGYVLYACESLCVCVYIDVCMCISISLCVFISVYVCMLIHMYIRSVCVCVEVQAFVDESCSLSFSAVLCLTPEPSVRCGHSVACIALHSGCL